MSYLENLRNEMMRLWLDERATITVKLINLVDLNRRFSGTCWNHKKTGRMYQIERIALDSETEEFMVVYYNIASPSTTWVRPMEMFMDGRFEGVD